LQFAEGLSDRQATEAVRARIDWKYALGLELSDRGFDFLVLSEFRNRLIAGSAEQLLLDRMLARFKASGYLKARGKQRTDSTQVLAAVRQWMPDTLMRSSWWRVSSSATSRSAAQGDKIFTGRRARKAALPLANFRSIGKLARLLVRAGKPPKTGIP
jgi:hypothetical protein